MLSWSNVKYKMTLGIGTLAVVGLIGDLTRNALPAWLAVAVALLPFAVFVFVHPRELPDRVVRVAHVAASAWYVVVAGGLLAALAVTRPLPPGWPVYAAFVAVGAAPCGVVLARAVRGRYRLPPGT